MGNGHSHELLCKCSISVQLSFAVPKKTAMLVCFTMEIEVARVKRACYAVPESNNT